MKKILVVILLLTGCSEIPVSGPVNSGLDITNSNRPVTDSEFIAQGPWPGMSKAEIVKGFLASHSSTVGDYSIARSYLSSVIATEWLPLASIQVFDVGLSVEEGNGDTVTVSGNRKLFLDENFRPALNPLPVRQEISLLLVLEQGEWRIINPPSGLILNNSDFQRVFELVPIWFVDKQELRLVPDFIAMWQQYDSAIQLVRALTYGSSNWLRPAVTNFLSPENIGGLISIKRDQEKIIVDMDATVLRLDERKRILLLSQLAQSLHGVSDVTQLEVTVGGQLLTGNGITNPLSIEDGTWFAQRNVKATTVYAISTTNDLIQPSSGLQVNSWLSQVSGPSSLTIASDEQRIAVWVPEKSEILVGYRTQNPRTIRQSAAITGINFDSNGTLWYLDTFNNTFYGFDGTDIKSTEVNITSTGNLTHAMVSPDNIRVAIITQAGSTSELNIMRLVRTNQGISLKDPLRITEISGSINDIDWLSSTQVVTLVRIANQSEFVAVIVDLATAAQTVVRLPAGTQSLDANGFAKFVVVDNELRIWERVTNTWEQIGTGRSATFARQ